MGLSSGGVEVDWSLDPEFLRTGSFSFLCPSTSAGASMQVADGWGETTREQGKQALLDLPLAKKVTYSQKHLR